MNNYGMENEEIIEIDNHKIKSMGNAIDNINNGLLHNVSVPHNIKSTTNNGSNPIFNNSNTLIKGIIEESTLSSEFFSTKNIQALQNSIRFNVHNQTNKIIDNQSTNELLTIMRSIFLQFSDSTVNSIDFLSHILGLNQQVSDFAVSQINTQITQFDGYIQKLSRLPTPIDPPVKVDFNNKTYTMDNLMG